MKIAVTNLRFPMHTTQVQQHTDMRVIITIANSTVPALAALAMIITGVCACVCMCVRVCVRVCACVCVQKSTVLALVILILLKLTSQVSLRRFNTRRHSYTS